MNNLILLSLSYVLLNVIYLATIIGYGRCFNLFFLKSNYFEEYQNLNFIFGLLILGIFSIIYNFFFKLSDYYSIIIITVGLIFYLINFIQKKNQFSLNLKKEIIFFLIIILISFCFSFYSGLNHDYGYHYETIKIFKNKTLFEITHQRMISYNSHWLLLNSIFYLSFNYSSLFILTGLIYGILLFDLFSLFNQKNKPRYDTLILYAFFSLVFFIGVLNKSKDYGTDFPGAIICIYILLIFINLIENEENKADFKSFIIMFLLANFAFMVKITNFLVYIFICIAFFLLRKNFKVLVLSLLLTFPIFLWMSQNFVISNCLIWPISSMCFDNVELAKREYYLVESFAKGDIGTSINTSGFNWIIIWLNNHLNKIIETYLLYIFIISIPLLFCKFKYKISYIKYFVEFYKNYKLKRLKSYLIPIIILNFIWFFLAPAYRFGVFYNLSLIIFLFIPFWVKIKKIELQTFKKSIKYILFIAVLFFVYENFTRIEHYNNKYGKMWPPIISNELTKY